MVLRARLRHRRVEAQPIFLGPVLAILHGARLGDGVAGDPGLLVRLAVVQASVLPSPAGILAVVLVICLLGFLVDADTRQNTAANAITPSCRCRCPSIALRRTTRTGWGLYPWTGAPAAA